MDRAASFERLWIQQVRTLERHPHPVIYVLMKGFARVALRNVFVERNQVAAAGSREVRHESANA